MKNKLKVVVMIALSALPLLALGAADVGTPIQAPGYQGPTGLGTVGGWFDLFRAILGWVQTAFWILAVIFILVAAFRYLTAAGDPEKVKSASHMLLYAVIAIVVALLAFGLPSLVQNFLQRT